MRLRRNEYCPIHKSISCCVGNKRPMRADCSLGLDALKICITHGDKGN